MVIYDELAQVHRGPSPSLRLRVGRISRRPGCLRLTLARAQHHIRDLDQVVQTFSDEHPWSYVLDTESQAPNKVYKIRFHTPQIMDLFRSVEPYKDGSGQVLWAVNKLCNTKKRGKLVPTMITGAWTFYEDADGTPIGNFDDNWMPDKGELVLMVVAPGDDTHFSDHIGFSVSVNSVDIIRDEPIVALLEGAVDSINGLLISAEAICQSLGFFS